MNTTETDLKIKKAFDEMFLDKIFDEAKYSYMLLFADTKSSTPRVRSIGNNRCNLENLIMLANAMNIFLNKICPESTKKTFQQSVHTMLTEVQADYLLADKINLKGKT